MGFVPIDSDVWFAIKLSFLCGVLSTLLTLPWGMFWGWVFARKNFPGKFILQTIFYLPLVLPPVLSGYFLLIIFGRHAPLGEFLFSTFKISFVLDWKGALLSSVFVSAPLMIEAMRQAYLNVDERLEWMSRSLGKDSWKTFELITYPLVKNGLMAGLFLVFARSAGEFGATLMVAGNIPNKSQTISSAIFSKVYTGQENVLWPLIISALIFSYAGLAACSYFLRCPPVFEKRLRK